MKKRPLCFYQVLLALGGTSARHPGTKTVAFVWVLCDICCQVEGGSRVRLFETLVLEFRSYIMPSSYLMTDRRREGQNQSGPV